MYNKDITRCNENRYSVQFSIIQYKKIEKLFYDFDYWLMRQNDRESLSYQDYVNTLLDKYKKRIEKILNNNNEGNKTLLEQINANISIIKSIIKDYLDGKILQSIQKTIDLVSNNKGGCVNDNRIVPIWYKGRLFSDIDYLRNAVRSQKDWKPSAKDMGIIPNTMRHLANTQRFSMLGFPCLYLGSSIIDCIKECRANESGFFFAAKYEGETFNKLQVADFRIPRYKKNNDKICEDLKTWPIVIACAIKVPKEKENGALFKDEYIFLQLLMLSITECDNVDACIYTSVHREEPLLMDNVSLWDNLAIPYSNIYESIFTPSENSISYIDIAKEIKSFQEKHNRTKKSCWLNKLMSKFLISNYQ